MIQSIINAHHYDIRIKKFGEVRVASPFFDSFRKYHGPYYIEWVKKKFLDPVYVVEENGDPIAFMKLKSEYEDEDYSDITPTFIPAKRLKICSFKVAWGNYGLSLIMMDIAISKAIFNNVSEIYGTIPIECNYKHDLVNFLHRFGFKKCGLKKSHGIIEEVYSKHVII